MTLALWFLAAFGVAYVIGYAKISVVMRELFAGIPAEEIAQIHQAAAAQGAVPPFDKSAIPPLIPHVGPWIAALMECPACIGWWLGLAASLAGLVAVPFDAPRVVTALLLAFATSAVNLLLAKWVGLT